MEDPFGPAPFGRSKSSSQPKVWAEKARRLFDNHPQLVVEDMRSDYTGILMRVKHTDGTGVSRRLMIKAAYPEVAAIVQNEGKWVDLLRYAKHIVTPVPIRGGSLTRSQGAGWRLPYVIMEYIENGTLRQFQQRIARAHRTLPDGTTARLVLPNRFLWSIFFCLLRACVGMAWPPAGPDVQLETPLAIQPLGLTHSDMHQGNIMFGRLYPEEAEHSRVPMVRLIDFGEANVMRPDASHLLVDEFSKNKYDVPLDLTRYRPASGSRNQAIDKNLMDIGCVMAQVLAGRDFAFVGACRGFIWDPDIHPSLDPDLRLLIQRCLAVDPLNRPRLEELTALIDGHIKTERDYEDIEGYDGLESDDTLEYIVSTFILDADTN
ncbi:hypothetical protein DL767_005122 [Monosporascus sp. MG133]|nr:hypothetical protein DL767_005122 [Monosporascus sp. MG133]